MHCMLLAKYMQKCGAYACRHCIKRHKALLTKHLQSFRSAVCISMLHAFQGAQRVFAVKEVLLFLNLTCITLKVLLECFVKDFDQIQCRKWKQKHYFYNKTLNCLRKCNLCDSKKESSHLKGLKT